MAYKFQVGPAIVSGSLTRDDGDLTIRNDANVVKATISHDTGVISGSGNLTIAGDLKMSGDVSRITAAGAASFTSIDGSGDLTVATITMDEFTVAANGNTDIDGTLNVEGVPTFQAKSVHSAGAEFADQGLTSVGSIADATNIDGSGDLTMGTITMSGFTVDADGDTALKSLAVDDSSTIGCDGDTDLLTLAAQSITVAADSSITYKGAAITSTGAELNLVDGSSAGTVVASKAVIYDALGGITGVGLTGSLKHSVDVAANSGITMTPFSNTANVADIALDLSTLSVGMVKADMGGDDVLGIYDTGNTTQKKVTLANLADKLAGAGLSADGGVLSTDSAATAQNIADAATAVEGTNFVTGALGGTFFLPENPSVGDKITLKHGSAGVSNLFAFDTNTIDGTNQFLVLESPFAAVTVIYSATSGSWSII